MFARIISGAASALLGSARIPADGQDPSPSGGVSRARRLLHVNASVGFRMVSNNYRQLKAVVDGDRAAFLIRGQLVDGHFALVPNINAATSAIAKAMDDVLNKLKSVPRWLATTNVRCPVVQRSDAAAGDDHLPYSFYDRAVVYSTHLIDAEKRCYDSVENIGDLLDGTAQKYITRN